MNDTESKSTTNTNFMAVDPSTLVDIQDVKIDITRTREERIRQYLDQIKNPRYCKCDDTIIKLNYPDTNITINDIIDNHISEM